MVSYGSRHRQFFVIIGVPYISASVLADDLRKKKPRPKEMSARPAADVGQAKRDLTNVLRRNA